MTYSERRMLATAGRAVRAVVAVAIATAVAAPAALAVSTTSPTVKDVTAAITLASTRVKAGAKVKGKLVLTNHSHDPVDLTITCRPLWTVVLGKGKTAPGVAFPAICGIDRFVVKPGKTRLSFTLRATYSGCTGDGPTSPGIPRCAADGRPPPLPPGKYRAFLVASDSFPRAPPLLVRIVAP
jgi:hypothetical protein